MRSTIGTVLDAEDLRRFRAGDADGVRAAYREYGRLVYAVCYSQLGSAELAEEAAQQTFVKAWRSAAGVEEGRDLAPWLATIARRTAIDVYRAEARHRAVAIDEVTPGHPALVAQATAGRAHEAWQVRQAVDELPPDEREVVRLQHLEGLPHTAIAERLGVPVGTVKSRSFRAHRKLAAKLGHLREGFD